MGCVELGLLHVDKDEGDEALTWFRRACYGGEYEGCSQLGAMYWKGASGLRKSPKMAVKFFEKGCKEGSSLACTRLADALAKGAKGVTKDPKRASELYEKSCKRGYVEACERKDPT